MIYINIMIVVLFVVLAILSRKHFSKYKDKNKNGIGCWLVALGLSMGEYTWNIMQHILPVSGLRNGISSQLRKRHVVSPKRLELLTDRFIAKSFAVCMGIVLSFNFLELGSAALDMSRKGDGNIIEREEYSGDARKEEISFWLLGEEYRVFLDVSPVKLSRDEFDKRANQIAKELKEELFEDGMVHNRDIVLPQSYDQGAFELYWESANPEIISSRGKLKLMPKEEPVEATLMVKLVYYEYSAEYSFKILVGLGEKDEKELESKGIEQVLVKLEQEKIYEKSFLLPEDVNGIKIELAKTHGDRGRYLMLGLVLGVVAIVAGFSGLKEKAGIRDKELIKAYPFFVDSLWLYIEAGMNIRRAIKQYVECNEDSVLVEELRFTLNKIDTGEAEYEAYENLGMRLGIPIYGSLMRHISQNLKMGTKDLRSLMETEVTMALEAKKESVKKMGEEASAKLVLPMIVLLVVVMVIIMTPAFMEF